MHLESISGDIGLDVSVGVPKLLPYAKRWDYGKTYYWKNYGDYQGWETRKGSESSILWLYTYGETQYEAGEFSQTVGYKKFGIPGILGADIYNDLWGDGRDRFRTSRVRLNAFPFYMENILFTGDPGLYKDDRETKNIEKSWIPFAGGNDGAGTYVRNPNNPYADPDRYRHGVLALGMGSLSVGLDAEWIRYFFQNVIVHNITDSPYFRYIKGKKTSFYFQFGTW